MKVKRKHYLLFIGALFLMTAVHFYASHKQAVFSDIAMANVEAIANSDEVDGGKITCYTTFTNKNKGSHTVKDCGDCMDVDCEDYTDSGKCKK